MIDSLVEKLYDLGYNIGYNLMYNRVTTTTEHYRRGGKFEAALSKKGTHCCVWKLCYGEGG